MESKVKIIGVLVILFVLSVSCNEGPREHVVEAPRPLDVLGTDIEDLKRNMSEADLVYSGSKFAGKNVKKKFEWEFIPKMEKSEEFKKLMSDYEIENIKENEKSESKSTFSVGIDRNGRIVSARIKRVFNNEDTFRAYYKLRLSLMMERTRVSGEVLCLSKEPSFTGAKVVNRFELQEEEVGNWSKVKKCEESGWKVKNQKGQNEITNFALGKNFDEKEDENKGEMYVMEDASFEGYQ